MLNIDGKEIKLKEFNTDSFEKASSIKHAWNYDKTENITFDKKGSELKGILYAKKYQLETKKTMCIEKMAALKQQIGESKSGSREGQVENIENYIEYALPHDNVKEMNDEEKTAYAEFRTHMWMLKKTEDDLKVVQTLLDNLVDDKTYTLSLEQLNTIQKGDVASEFPSYGDNQLTFSKKGKEIKEKVAAKKSRYEGKKSMLMAKASAILSALAQKNIEPKSTYYSEPSLGEYDDVKMPTFPYEMHTKINHNDSGSEMYVEDEKCREMMQEYNSLVYQIRQICADIKVMDIMLSNMEDEKSYKLNIRQIAVIEKALNASDVLKATKGKRDKVGKVMKEFKEGKLTSHGKKVTDKKQALAIAMSEAGLSKDDFSEIKKFYPPWDVYNYDVEGVKVDNQGEEKDDATKSSHLKKAFDELM